MAVSGWIEQARQRAEDLIGAGAGSGLAAIAGLTLLSLAVLVLVAMPALRRHRGSAGGRRETDGKGDETASRARALVAEAVAALRSGAGADPAAFKRAERIEEQGRHLFQAVNALLRLSKGWSRSARAIEPALAALRLGDTAPAARLLGALAGSMTAKEAGDAVSGAHLRRHQAAMAFVHAPAEALAPARQAAELAPSQPLGWSLLGIVAGELADHELARSACETVLKLGGGPGGQGLLAGAVGTLGEIHLARGDLERAEEAFRIALTHQAGLARPESMVRNYRGLAQVEMARGDWARAAEIVDKAITLETGLGHREGMADLELQAGLIAQRRGDLSGAFARWAKARQLFEAIGAAEKIGALDRLIARSFPDRPLA